MDQSNEFNSISDRPKRPRSNSGGSGGSIDMEEIMKAIRNSEERVVSTMVSKIEAMFDSKLTELRLDFDSKLAALSSSVDDRLNNVLKNTEHRLSDVASTTDAIGLISDLRICSLERAQCLHDVVINNIPYMENEDVKSIYVKICEAIGFCGGLHAISSTFRLPNKSLPAATTATNLSTSSKNRFSAPLIIVKFVNVDYSHQFISAYLKFKILNLTHIGFSSPTRIFINENLTKRTRELFRYCLSKKHMHKSFFLKLFTRAGQVYVVFDGLDKPVVVTSDKELDNYISSFIQ